MENLVFTKGYKDVRNIQEANFMVQRVAFQLVLVQSLRPDNDPESTDSSDLSDEGSDHNEFICKSEGC